MFSLCLVVTFIFMFDSDFLCVTRQSWPRLHSSLRGIPGIVCIPHSLRSLNAWVTDTHLKTSISSLWQKLSQIKVVIKKHLFFPYLFYILLYFDTKYRSHGWDCGTSKLFEDAIFSLRSKHLSERKANGCVKLSKRQLKLSSCNLISIHRK